MATHGMTIAKASKDDFEKVYNLLSPMEELFNSKWCNEEGWTEWDDDDENKQELLAIRKEIAEDEYCEEDEVDNRLILYEFIKRRMRRCGCSNWQRVVIAAECLIDTFCDPQESSLCWRPDLEEVEVGNQTSIFGEDDRKRVLLRQEYVVETICKDLEREGYSVQPMLIPACAVGAPHRRDRVWIIANRTDTGTESMQQTGEDGVHAVGSTSNTNCQRSEEVHKEIQSQKPNGERADGSRCELFTTHACGDGWSGRCCKGGGNENKETFGGNVLAKTKGFSWEQPASDSDSKRFPTFGFTSSVNKEEWTNENRCPMQSSCNAGRTSRTDWWKEFPTQSPVCRRNDGLPFNVHDLTIPFTKWRQESVKGYGNAIVPQVILEIFKAIEGINDTA